ncbi:MAG: hypothetical protein ACC726_02775 [Chloroflexota bacterium]
MIGLDRPGVRRRPIDRSDDRLVAMAAIAIAIGYLTAAALAAFLPTTARAGSWLPLHLALAGAASTAIAGVMPFFSAAFAAAPPTDARLRWASLLSVAAGAAAVSIGVVGDVDLLAAAGGGLFIVGMVMVGFATVRPRRLGLGPKGGLVTRGYLLALAMVTMGAALATLYLLGWLPVVERWAYLKPVHEWLNLVGFVSLVIATTLLHFFPTVIGAHIQQSRSAHLTVAGLALGASLVALGFALQSDVVARAGALAVALGAISLAVYAGRAWVTRSHWSGDASWHLFAMGGLVAAIAWFELGMLLAAGRVMIEGADPAAAAIDLLIGPLVMGWMGLAILASATHLVPAVGPGDRHAHARQRHILGRGAAVRLVGANIGIGAVALGLPWGLHLLVAAGMVAVAVALGATALLIGAAVTVGLRDVRRAHPSPP